jgi:hypothetical protein
MNGTFSAYQKGTKEIHENLDQDTVQAKMLAGHLLNGRSISTCANLLGQGFLFNQKQLYSCGMTSQIPMA